jgi:hypothetical protein
LNSTLLDTQKDDREDAVYNGRPIQLTAPPLSIYHPVFATFKQKIAEPIDRATFTSTELRNAHQLIIDSVAFYADEKTRISKIQESLNVLVPNSSGTLKFHVANGLSSPTAPCAVFARGFLLAIQVLMNSLK